jgi:hypothetical protein
MDRSTRGQRTALIVGMSLAVAALVAAGVVVLVLLVFTNDTNSAKDLIGQASPHMAMVQQKVIDLAPQVEAIINQREAYSSVVQFDAAVAPARETLNSINTYLDKATISYNRILSFKGLEDYKAYARTAMDLVRNDHVLTAQVTDYIEYLRSIAQAKESGQEVSPVDITTRTEQFIAMFNGLRTDAQALKDKAENMKATL